MCIQNVLVKGGLRSIRKPISASEQTVQHHLARTRRKETGASPERAQRTCRIDRGSWQEIACCNTVRLLHAEDSKRYVLYLHEGDYTFEQVAQHWYLLSTMVNCSERTALVPLSPLAPEHIYQDTYPWLLALYQHLCNTVHLTIMGEGNARATSPKAGHDNFSLAGHDAPKSFHLQYRMYRFSPGILIGVLFVIPLMFRKCLFTTRVTRE